MAYNRNRGSERTNNDIFEDKNVVSLDYGNFDQYVLDQYARQESREKQQIVDYNSFWEDLKQVCGGNNTIDYIVMYLKFYLGLSERRITEILGNKVHTGTRKRITRIINYLRLIHGLPKLNKIVEKPNMSRRKKHAKDS